MLKFIVLFFAAFAVFSPLFLIGIRKYTGRRAKRALGAHIASFFAFLVLASVVGIGGSASAAGTPEAAAAAGGIAEGLKYVGAALAVAALRVIRPEVSVCCAGAQVELLRGAREGTLGCVLLRTDFDLISPAGRAKR